jgi:hypothetical protein
MIMRNYPYYLCSAIIPIALSCHALAGTSVVEQSIAQAPEKPSSAWWLTIAPYAWVTATEGDMGVAGRVAPVDISFEDTLEELEFAFMIAAEAGIDRWVFGIDAIYGASSSSAALPAAAAPFTRGNVDFDQFFGRVHAGYQVIEQQDTRLTAFIGMRYSYLSTEIILSGGAPPVTADGSKSWVDPVIGMHGVWDLNDRWFLHGGGDIGGFGVNSDLIWQANLALGYRMSESLSLVGGYRGLGVDFTDGGFLVDTVAHGPVIGLNYRF